MIASAQEQFRQNNPHFARSENETQAVRDESFDEGDDDGQRSMAESPYGTREPQPYIPRESQPFQQSQSPQPQQVRGQADAESEGEVDRLPSFITGGQQPGNPSQYNSGQGPNGHDSHDRFPLHRRRRRHRGPRHDVQGSGEGSDESSRRGD